MSELTELIARYSDTVRPDETPLQFCHRVSQNGHSKLELAILLRDLFGLGLRDCSQVMGTVEASDDGNGITHYISDAKRELRQRKCSDEITRLHLLGLISESEVVNAIFECYHDDTSGMAHIVSQLRNNIDNDFGDLADRLENLIKTENAG